MNQTHEWVLIGLIGIAFTAAMIAYLNEEFSESVEDIQKKKDSKVGQINEKISVIEVKDDNSKITIYVMNYGKSDVEKRATIPKECTGTDTLVPTTIGVIQCPGTSEKITLITENFNTFTLYDKTE